MYNYIFVDAQTDGLFRNSNYQELITEYAAKGYRFVTAIPKEFGTHGDTKRFDLVFEETI